MVYLEMYFSKNLLVCNRSRKKGLDETLEIFSSLCSICQNGAELPPNSTSTIPTDKVLFCVSLGSFLLPPIDYLSDKELQVNIKIF